MRARPMACFAMLAWCGAVACTGPREGDGSIRVTERDSAGIRVVQIEGDVQALPTWTLSMEPVAEASGEAPPYLGTVGEVALLPSGAMLVDDNQTAQLHIFDPTGTHLRALGGRGDGPGEFQAIATLSVAAGDTIWAYDSRHYRLTVFDPEGGYVRAVTIGRELAGPTALAFDAWAIDSDRIIVRSIGPGDNSFPAGAARRDYRDAILHALDGAARPRVPPLAFTGGYSVRGNSMDASTPFANTPFVSVRGDRVLYGSGLTYELTLGTDALEPTRIVRWEGWVHPLTDDVLAARRTAFDTALESTRESNPDMAERLTSSIFSPDVLPEELPALSEALLDDRGRMWVRPFRLMADYWDQQDAWHVLDHEGRPLETVRLPPRARLVAVQADRVVLVMADELDVQHVRVFAVEAPNGA